MPPIPLPLTGVLLDQYNNLPAIPPTTPLGDVINTLAAGSSPWVEAGGVVSLVNPTSTVDMSSAQLVTPLTFEDAANAEVTVAYAGVGIAKSLTVKGADTAGGFLGGNVGLVAGATDTSLGGRATVSGGESTGVGVGGPVYINGGSSSVAGATGGDVFISSGGTTDPTKSVGAGNVFVSGGAVYEGAVPGAVRVTGSAGYGAIPNASSGGDVLISGGASLNALGGNVQIEAGNGGAADGTVSIGTAVLGNAQTSAVNIGKTGIYTTLKGGVAMEFDPTAPLLLGAAPGSPGNAGEVLTSNGPLLAPTWQAGGGGGGPWTEAAGVVSLNNAAWVVNSPLLMDGAPAVIKTPDSSANTISVVGGTNTTGGVAGNASVTGGFSFAGTGGQASIAGGAGNGGGAVRVEGGGGTGAAGGKVTVTSGFSTGANTGDVDILTPNSMGSSASGSILIETGSAPGGSANTAGSISVLAGWGSGGFPAGNIGGNIDIKAGDGNGQGGTLTLWAGNSVGTPGTIEINRVGGTTNILGTLNAPYAAGGGVGVVWAVSVPTTIKDALDRIAAQLAILGGGPIP